MRDVTHLHRSHFAQGLSAQRPHGHMQSGHYNVAGEREQSYERSETHFRTISGQNPDGGSRRLPSIHDLGLLGIGNTRAPHQDSSSLRSHEPTFDEDHSLDVMMSDSDSSAAPEGDVERPDNLPQALNPGDSSRAESSVSTRPANRRGQSSHAQKQSECRNDHAIFYQLLERARFSIFGMGLDRDPDLDLDTLMDTRNQKTSGLYTTKKDVLYRTTSYIALLDCLLYLLGLTASQRATLDSLCTAPVTDRRGAPLGVVMDDIRNRTNGEFQPWTPREKFEHMQYTNGWSLGDNALQFVPFLASCFAVNGDKAGEAFVESRAMERERLDSAAAERQD